MPTLNTSFVKRSGCFINAPFAGGKYQSLYDPETCGQLCINDGCCESFVSGYGLNLRDCFLAYVSASSNPELLVCDPQKQFDYYQKICWLMNAFQ